MNFIEVAEFIEKGNFEIEKTEYVNESMDVIRIIWKNFKPDDWLITPKQMNFTFTFPFDIDSFAVAWEAKNPGKKFNKEGERSGGTIRDSIALLFPQIIKNNLLRGSMKELVDYLYSKRGFIAGKKFGL